MKQDFKHIVFLTGAGISAPSGIPTFRDADGLWKKYPMEEVATIEGFYRNPDRVHDFIRDLKASILSAQPNSAHYAITHLQNNYIDLQIAIITQNIDTLHEKAESRNIYHIHGRIDEAVCMRCHYVFKNCGNVSSQTECPECRAKGEMKPNVVLFHEPIHHTKSVEYLLKDVELFIAVGTSGTVFPAAQFAQIAKQNGAKTILFDMEKSTNPFFDEQIIGNAAETLPKFINELLH